MEIYAPLAERIGMQQVKDELEDLAFGELNPEARESIVAAAEFPARDAAATCADRIMAELKKALAGRRAQGRGVRAARRRPIRSGARCSARTSAFEQLSDIMAFRVVVDDIAELLSRRWACSMAAIRWCPAASRTTSRTPKPNGYRSLHTGVIGPEQQRIEIQIRTEEMHEMAELGVAAHWGYKQGAAVGATARQYRWLRELLDILEQAAEPEEFLEHTKLEMFQDQVFCFTPKGDLIALPRGATPVDFAYAVHSEVGDTCVGAKINGRMMPLRTAAAERRPGRDRDARRAQTPSPTWERFVVTGKARALHPPLHPHPAARAVHRARPRHPARRPSSRTGYEFTDKALDGVLKQFHAEDASRISTPRSARGC